jgi:hypothetical protein
MGEKTQQQLEWWVEALFKEESDSEPLAEEMIKIIIIRNPP